MQNNKSRIAIDFGTSNTGISINRNGKIELIKIDDHSLKSIRSIIYFENQLDYCIGQFALDSSLKDVRKGRLIRWIKRALPKKLKHVNIYNKHYTIEELISLILKEAKRKLEELGYKTDTIIAGRPVTFDQSGDQNELAFRRLKTAFDLAGFKGVEFIPEPVAAANHYSTHIKSDCTGLLIDIGGGTTDYSLVSYIKKEEKIDCHVIDIDGIAKAGQDYDEIIWWSKIAPILGYQQDYDFLGEIDRIPRSIYEQLLSPQKSMMNRLPRFYKLIEQAIRSRLNKAPFFKLKFVIDHHLSTYLLGKCELLKINASNREINSIALELDDKVEISMTGAEFKEITAPVSNALLRRLDEFLNKNEHNVDVVILTGGMAKHSLIAEEFRLFLSKNRFCQNAKVLTEETDAIVLGLAK